MRIAHVVGPVLVPALLVVAATAGCGGGHRPSGQVLPGPQARLGATVAGDGVLPGDQRQPDSAARTTTTTVPIGRTSSPVVRPLVPVTRPPLQLGVVTTTSTSPAAITTVATAPTAAGAGAG